MLWRLDRPIQQQLRRPSNISPKDSPSKATKAGSFEGCSPWIGIKLVFLAWVPQIDSPCCKSLVHLCEQVLSSVSINKTNLHSRLTHKHLNAILKLTATQNLTPDIDAQRVTLLNVKCGFRHCYTLKNIVLWKLILTLKGLGSGDVGVWGLDEVRVRDRVWHLWSRR